MAAKKEGKTAKGEKQINCTLPGADMLEQGKSVKEIRTINRFLMMQLDADRLLLKAIGKSSVDKGYAIRAMHILRDSRSTPFQKMTAAVILDYCDAGWRDKVEVEVVGCVTARNDLRVFAWRRTVLDRDNRICTKCGSKEKLEAHHILMWAFYPEARLMVDNGTTLCQTCHTSTTSEQKTMGMVDYGRCFSFTDSMCHN